MSFDSLQVKMLDFLLDYFIKESEDYKDLDVSDSIDEKRRILRSLMNVRMPKEVPSEVLKVQDEYLTKLKEEKGIVDVFEIPFIKERISIWQGDITRLKVGAIVNAANSAMLGCFVPMHNCIDNQIHSFAGVELRNECNDIMNEFKSKFGSDYRQPTSVPIITDGYNLPAKKVVHVVGPIVYDNLTEELEDDLRNCYINTLDLCLKNGVKSVAFCCISTGVFNFPNKRAAEIATEAVLNWLNDNKEGIDRVIFNVFKDEDRSYYYECLR